MNDLRTAAQQALEALELAQTEVYWELNSPTRKFLCKAEKNLRAALAEPVQEPVAWRYKPMAGSPWSLSDDGYYISCKRDSGYIIEPLYTAAPPQRKPLTEDEIALIVADCSASAHRHDDFSFARAIERAHGIGDNT